MSTGTVALVGGTGLVGGECLRLLLEDAHFSRVVAVTRRALPAETRRSSKLDARVIDFEQLERHDNLFAVAAVICALGTTIRKAGSQAEFRRVDFDYPLAVARLALDHGARHFLLVSALGANARSRFFYNRVKGELEAQILALPFAAHTIVRPSLLLGERAEYRLAERFGSHLGFLLPRVYRPVSAAAVARALVNAARGSRPGKRIIESVEIRTGQ